MSKKASKPKTKYSGTKESSEAYENIRLAKVLKNTGESSIYEVIHNEYPTDEEFEAQIISARMIDSKSKLIVKVN